MTRFYEWIYFTTLGTNVTMTTMKMSSTRIWVTTARGARASSAGSARARGRMTRELRVVVEKISARWRWR